MTLMQQENVFTILHVILTQVALLVLWVTIFLLVLLANVKNANLLLTVFPAARLILLNVFLATTVTLLNQQEHAPNAVLDVLAARVPNTALVLQQVIT
jgi:hypothetical protein